MKYNTENSIYCFNGDIPNDLLEIVSTSGVVACDIETSGLDWKECKIGTIQLFCAIESPIIVKINQSLPLNICLILENKKIKKIFHHAIFDLRFIINKWNIKPTNISCTKIASKLLDPSKKHNHSLKQLLRHYLGVNINKDQQVSDWLSENLSEKQINYATSDVMYLIDLLKTLEEELQSKDLLDLAHSCFYHIPTRAKLDVLEYPDIYTY